MKKILGIMVLGLLLSGNAYAKVKSKDITFPGKFYTKEIKSCSALPNNVKFDNAETFKTIEDVIGFDWAKFHTETGTSLIVNHDVITVPGKLMLTAIQHAIANNNQTNLDMGKDLLLRIAKADTLYNSISYEELQKKPRCWVNNDPDSPCWYHEFEFAGQTFGNFMIAAIYLKSEFNKKELKEMNRYIDKMHKKFLKPIQFRKNDKGFYAMANGGLSTLVYASWTNNKKLAAKEINHTFNEIDSLFYKDGYINDNSFRGLRGQWYHSYGVNIALGYVYIAKLWGAKVPAKVQNKLVNSAKVVNLAITDPDKFAERKNPNGKARNRIKNKNSATPHTHQMAIAIDTLMEIVAGIELEHDPIYLSKRKMHIPDGTDDLIGFNPNCIH
ncbi:peptidoglycan-binding protein [Candidatus Pelagibacter sp.]|nr:peptidoglycan-binding protein [Candidatus Pelagibacter sp.]